MTNKDTPSPAPEFTLLDDKSIVRGRARVSLDALDISPSAADRWMAERGREALKSGRVKRRAA